MGQKARARAEAEMKKRDRHDPHRPAALRYGESDEGANRDHELWVFWHCEIAEDDDVVHQLKQRRLEGQWRGEDSVDEDMDDAEGGYRNRNDPYQKIVDINLEEPQGPLNEWIMQAMYKSHKICCSSIWFVTVSQDAVSRVIQNEVRKRFYRTIL